MKKILLTCLVALTTLAMASCHKDIDLAGTTWKVSYAEDGDTESYELIFADNVNGTLSCLETYADEEDAYADTTRFTYTFDGKADGTMAMIDDEGFITNTTFEYDKDEDAIRVFDGIYALTLTKW